MASQDMPKPRKEDAPKTPPAVNADEILKPFQEASVKFLQASFSAQEAALRLHAKTCLEVQDEVRKVEQEAYQAVMAATRKPLEAQDQPFTGSPQEMFAARAQLQFNFEKEVRQIYIDSHSRIVAIAEKVAGREGDGGSAKLYSDQRQEAQKAYMADLQRAWSATQALDPPTMNAIASSIQFTLNVACQAG